MAFTITEFSIQMQNAPELAHERLTALFVEHEGNVAKVATVIGVNRGTVFRWLRRFEALKLPDPRQGGRGKAGRPPMKQA